MDKKKKVFRKVIKFILIFIGTILAAAGLEFFIVPNQMIDGGIVGISIMASYLTKIPLGILTFLLNLPFLIIGYKQIGKTFVITSLFANASFSFWVSAFHPIPGLTKDMLLAAVFGGMVLGVGVGIILRYGGSLDGTEIVALIVSKRMSFSVGQIVMFFNLFILGSSGLLYGWDRAMYSLIAYFIAYKVIDVTIEGLDEEKAAYIISDSWKDIGDAIIARLGRGVTYLDGKGGFTMDNKVVIYSVVTRLEIAKLKTIIQDFDEGAFMTVQDVSDIMGGKHKKRAIH